MRVSLGLKLGCDSTRNVVRRGTSPFGGGDDGPIGAGRSQSIPIEVYLESGAKRVFACSLEWPGWCRSGKTEELALDSLASYGSRYAVVVAHAGVEFNGLHSPRFDVRERLVGNATTDFGVPGAVASADHELLTGDEASRLVSILRAAWSVLDNVVETSPAELRKGPRGGGRDRDAIADHVVAAEYAYARKFGLRGSRQPAAGDARAVEAMRNSIAEAVLAPDPPEVDRGWPPRYAARRIAWHVLDHAWEIEDRSVPEG